VWVDRRTDMKELVVNFQNYRNTPNNGKRRRKEKTEYRNMTKLRRYGDCGAWGAN
jgi:hypothetical protein